MVIATRSGTPAYSASDANHRLPDLHRVAFTCNVVHLRSHGRIASLPVTVDFGNAERKLVAIVSADVAGYSRLMADDEVATARALAAYRDEIQLLVRQNRGRVVDATGDNILAEFPSALDATLCAVEIQRVLYARNADRPPHRRMEFRIGVHLGDVMVEGERIIGDGVNIAARLERLAEPGAICVSGAVYEQVRGKLALPCEHLGEQTVKNIPYPLHVYRIRLQSAERPVASPSAGGLAALAERSDIAVFVVPTAWVLYVAIVFEIIFMASPFGLYFYSFYGLPLQLLEHSRWTAWLTTFFLPHISQTSSAWLNGLGTVGDCLVLAGTVIFAAGFVQIYAAKVRQRGAVTGGLYAWVRHPQYLGLGIVGLGTLLIWPRFLVLVTYITMLFLYGLLARSEEERCLRRFGESYYVYQQQTGTFLPRWLRGGMARLWPGTPRRRLAMVAVLYPIAIVASVFLAGRLRDYSLQHVSAFYSGNMAVLSPAQLTADELRSAVGVATADAGVRAALVAAGPTASLLVYVVPAEWELADLPIPLPEKRHSGHYTQANFDRRVYKVLFSKARTHVPGRAGADIIKTAYGQEPITLAHVNLETRQSNTETPPAHVYWGDIPTPLF